MDPFIEVLEDAKQQEKDLSQFVQRTRIITDDANANFLNNLQDLTETIEDLNESIESSRSNPEFFKISTQTLKEREGIVAGLKKASEELRSQWTQKKSSSGGGVAETQASDGSNPFARYDDDPDAANAQFNAYQQQEMIREQDQHLDGVYASMQTINQQARAMGTELEEQGYLMEELEGDLDRVGGKVGRGLKRVEHVIRANQERASDCCIGLLIVALIILLFMVAFY
ncbi:CYFA0S06e02080g1_1 [Cyberlindnera fabianii]|uniref:t-SNARE affecting a late Golgi compartment protein 1 n=1 Tax=Cyberlindnera fabianii TaxID=36022 RepID=A0A061AVB3_CYBFA|nr:T-SNARE affecting a late Golgi compartment protein 1 [Cyberlindnera fabianii]CDR41120.1 CYFA0S06e02080g1_1 [Cyberlindnera fabianii]